MTSWLVCVDLLYACFGLVIVDGVVARAPPIAFWTIGRLGREVVAYYRRKGAHVSWQEIHSNDHSGNSKKQTPIGK